MARPRQPWAPSGRRPRMLPATRCLGGLLLAAFLADHPAGWRQFQTWNVRQWCEQALDPAWPYAYSKSPLPPAPADPLPWEPKGRTASNAQHMGHLCDVRGSRTKCHICEDIVCGPGLNQTCALQLQGVDWDKLPRNIPTVSDTPFAVGAGVKHRYDYGAAESVCVLLSAGKCIATDPSIKDFNSCTARCWGSGLPAPTPYSKGWRFRADLGYPQGQVFTLAGGSGGPGYRDGPAASAKFNNPQGVAVDSRRTVYVADTDNHVIRAIYRNGTVVTIAGSGAPGWKDGPAAGARFSHPAGVAVYETICSPPANVSVVNVVNGSYVTSPGTAYDGVLCNNTVIIVADTRNHRIRRIINGVVETLAGGANQTEAETLVSPAGLADGWGSAARFDTPMGVAVDDNGNVFVADTRNNVIRFITPSGHVRTLAGRTVHNPKEGAGCPAPCLRGIPGYVDGPASLAQFYQPYSVAIGPGHPYTLVVVDGNRVRIVGRAGQRPLKETVEAGGSGSTLGASEAQILTLDTVYTVAGRLGMGEEDGFADEGYLENPRGVAVTTNGRLYVSDSSRCRIRSVTSAELVAQTLECRHRMMDLIRPTGCTSYDQVTDAIDRMGTALLANVHYNYKNERLNGRFIRECVGTPPPDIGVRSINVTLGPNNGTDAAVFTEDEDTSPDTTFLVRCPPGCAPLVVPGDVTGTDLYSDDSYICAAAVHAGLISDSQGGVLQLNLRKGTGPLAAPPRNFSLVGTTRNGVTSVDAAAVARTFDMSPVDVGNRAVLQTVAGVPAAPLHGSCGLVDAKPPLAARFAGPSGVAVYRGVSHLSQAEYLYIADAHNHAVRALTASCSQICENGGYCSAPDVCTCPPGWAGVDCTIPVCTSACSDRRVCTGPNTCSCVPGYTGPLCNIPQCVQTCANGGKCVAPDTCACAPGWFDANCTTPVCHQTCGNGGNCTAADTCTCPSMWTGRDCRVPVCPQGCANGGTCVAPDTCFCPPSWSGHDCSKPVCSQGYFRPDPIPDRYAASLWREPTWDQFVPCEHAGWCDATKEFECIQQKRTLTPLDLPPVRNWTGHKTPVQTCFPIEVNLTARTPFRYENETGGLTGYYRFTPLTPYGWGPNATYHPWSAPAPAAADRQVALVSYRRVSQGVYVCANGGNCTAPDVCKCAPGWVGFDCRTPVCTQGFYYPTLTDPRFPGEQGTYRGSKRALTLWEAPASPNGKFRGYLHAHPNFHSRAQDMDARLGLPVTHQLVEGVKDETNEGWRRDGWWEKVPAVKWQQGLFFSTYNRTCGPSTLSKAVDLRNGKRAQPVDDTFGAFRTRLQVFDSNITWFGRWDEAGGECVDQVLLGCFNEGVCVAPNTCKCAPGWEGHDCSLPICKQTVGEVTTDPDPLMPPTLLRANGSNFGLETSVPALPGDRYVQYRKCLNNGNCTLPDTCTCEKGWTGENCTIPLCAQDCNNGGFCSAPDTCTCPQRPTTFIDRRGRPMFQKPDGEPQSTGWTGYDCNTPICVQAERWVPNDDTGLYPTTLFATANDGRSFQSGCPADSSLLPPKPRRMSDYLCGQAVWFQGVYQDTTANIEGVSYNSRGRFVRINHPNYKRDGNGTWYRDRTVVGEGIYACYNKGSCTAPDTCTCPDGWSGYDCNTPLCRFTDTYGNKLMGCANGGVCSAPDTCTCPTHATLLTQLDQDYNPRSITGWGAADCTMPICTQGFFDPLCRDVAPGPGGPASMGAGCYRCANGGNCTAPDRCVCAPGWTGYDCRTPVCTMRATESVVYGLNTIDEAVIDHFEADPCGETFLDLLDGRKVGRGNCTRPGVCTCLCRKRLVRDASGAPVEKPYADPLGRLPPRGYTFSTSECLDGWEGFKNEDGTFASCHLRIYVPSYWEKNALALVIGIGVALLIAIVLYFVLRWYIRRRYIKKLALAKAKELEEQKRKERALAAAAAAAGVSEEVMRIAMEQAAKGGGVPVLPSAPAADDDDDAGGDSDDDPKPPAGVAGTGVGSRSLVPKLPDRLAGSVTPGQIAMPQPGGAGATPASPETGGLRQRTASSRALQN